MIRVQKKLETITIKYNIEINHFYVRRDLEVIQLDVFMLLMYITLLMRILRSGAIGSPKPPSK